MLLSPANPEFCRLARRLIAEGLGVRFTVHGRSMGPGIRNGDVVTLGAARPQTLKKGQIIAYETAAGALAIHRLTAIRKARDAWILTACGDANLNPDPPFNADRLVGCVTGLERAGQPVKISRTLHRWRAAARRGALAVLQKISGPRDPAPR